MNKGIEAEKVDKKDEVDEEDEDEDDDDDDDDDEDEEPEVEHDEVEEEHSFQRPPKRQRLCEVESLPTRSTIAAAFRETSEDNEAAYERMREHALANQGRQLRHSTKRFVPFHRAPSGVP